MKLGKTLKNSSMKVERSTIQIRFSDICRFSKEVKAGNVIVYCYLFLDEMSFDNRDMLRYRVWFLKGSVPSYVCNHKRKERISILAFMSVFGIEETYQINGAFKRRRFMECLRKLIKDKKVKRGSVIISNSKGS